MVLARIRPRFLASPNFARLQSAHRRGHSAETALLHVMNGIYVVADNKATTIVSLDIWAAFDTIDHDVLWSRFGMRVRCRWCSRQLAMLVSVGQAVVPTASTPLT